ncbi:transcription termination factor Rho [Bifidobacterium sp. BRDM6]|uniref:Transcription termination factor Rho n=2 Tax=Bifidobacterium choloepi TaxID=2614131 RepID=A0A6I5N2A6_9BIFI|nr:transcription termination factor Rho [Bifidobacterium choloepi]NEG70305.1 transcription termination factor Rho [Bifidobacterium choloepi]
MKMAELKELAKQMGLRGTSSMRKGDLIDAIESVRKGGAPAADTAPSQAAGKNDSSVPAGGKTEAAAGDVKPRVRDAAPAATGAASAAKKAAAQANDHAAAALLAEQPHAAGAAQDVSAASPNEAAPAAADHAARGAERAADHAVDHAVHADHVAEHADRPDRAGHADHEAQPRTTTLGDADLEGQPMRTRRRRVERAAGAPAPVDHIRTSITDADEEPRLANRRVRRRHADVDPAVEQIAEHAAEDLLEAIDAEHHGARADRAERHADRGADRNADRNGEQRENRRRRGSRDDHADQQGAQGLDDILAALPEGQNGDESPRRGRNNRNADRAERADRNADRGERNERADRSSDRNADRNERNGRNNDRNERRRGRNLRHGDEQSDRRERNNDRNERDRRDEAEDLVPVAGIVDVLDSYAFIRTSGYLPGPNDVYVSMGQIKKYGLRKGDAVHGSIKPPHEGDRRNQRQKFVPLQSIDSINGMSVEEAQNRPNFSKLTPLYPSERLKQETAPNRVTGRLIDLCAPIGKGQRGLIVSPPKAGKTITLQNIANAIATNNPEVHLMVVLVDERPEEVTDMERTVQGEVISSTFDRPASDHTTVAELAIERAKRLVELGQDVVVLLDSMTRLARAYNIAAPASGRILSGGVDAQALYPPKKFFGAARNIENGGSLTIIASALVETGSKMDEVIFEEFKGTGNMELRLSRELADKRMFPAVDINASGTRREELITPPQELPIIYRLRRLLGGMEPEQAYSTIVPRLKKSPTNRDFLASLIQGVGGNNGLN